MVADQPSNFGEDFRWDDGPGGTWSTFESDRWYHIQHRIVMNTPGVHDGIAQAWLDGVLVLSERGLGYPTPTNPERNTLADPDPIQLVEGPEGQLGLWIHHPVTKGAP